MTMHDTASLREALPYARRYARALAGSQGAGDALVAESLRRGLPQMPAHTHLHTAHSTAAREGNIFFQL